MREDGSIDYSSYTLPELLQASRSIDRKRYPKNFENLEKSIDALGGPDVSIETPADPIDTPAEYRMHAASLSGAYIIALAIIGGVLLIVLKRFGLVTTDAEMEVAVFVVGAVLVLTLTTAVRKRSAIDCPDCGERSLEPDLLSRYTARHRCRSCGFRLVRGKPVDKS